MHQIPALLLAIQCAQGSRKNHLPPSVTSVFSVISVVKNRPPNGGKPRNPREAPHTSGPVTVGNSSGAGYVLYLVLVLLAIGGVLFTISLTRVRMIALQTARTEHELQALLLAESGIARAEFFLNGGDGHDLQWESDALDESLDSYGSIHLSCRAFGGFRRVESVGERFGVRRSVRGIAGRDLPSTFSSTVTLTGRIGGLVLDDRTRLTGTVTLHHGSVRRGKNRGYIRGADRWTLYKELPPLPFDPQPLLDETARLERLLADALSDTASVAGPLRTSTGIPSSDSRLVVLGNCTVDSPLEDPLVVATGTIRFENYGHARDCAFLAEKVIVDGGRSERCLFFSTTTIDIAGGHHSSQFFAADTIAVAREADIGPAGFLFCHRALENDTTLTGGIVIAPHSRLSAHIICITDSTDARKARLSGPAITVGSHSGITGSLITDYDIEMRDISLEGPIYCRTILTMERETPHKNWLFGCELRPLRQGVPFPMIGEMPAVVVLERS